MELAEADTALLRHSWVMVLEAAVTVSLMLYSREGNFQFILLPFLCKI
jgi:hypothetical protein